MKNIIDKIRGILLEKNNLLKIVIIVFCICTVCFSMGLFLAGVAERSVENISVEVIGKETVDDEMVNLKLEVKNNGRQDIAAIKFILDIKDNRGNLLSKSEGSANFLKGDDGLAGKEIKQKTVVYYLNFYDDEDAAWYIYDAKYEELDFSVEVQHVIFTDGEESFLFDSGDVWSGAMFVGLRASGAVAGTAFVVYCVIRFRSSSKRAQKQREILMRELTGD